MVGWIAGVAGMLMRTPCLASIKMRQQKRHPIEAALIKIHITEMAALV
jgi:hypothetical protein